MSDLAAEWLAVVADWSVRWGVLIAGLALVFAVRPPRAVATRLWLGRLVLAGGLALPLLPHWWWLGDASREGPPNGAPVGATAAVVAVRPDPEVSSETSAALTGAEGPGEDLAPTPAATVVRPDRPATADWPLVLAGGWLAVWAVLTARLVGGWWWLARARAAASPAPDDHGQELEAVRAELGVRRRVGLLVSPAVAGPVLFGGRRPAVVVPPGWEAVAAADRRAALLHELAHVAHGDDLARAGCELVRAAFFFHPLVHWLLNRLDADRERRCDAAAVRHGVSPRALARVLLDGAKRIGAGRSALGPAALPFFSRNCLKERIHTLLDENMTIWTKPQSKWWSAVAAAVVLGVCVGLGGFALGVPGAARAEPAPPAAAADPGLGKLAGRLTDAAGKPVPGATVSLDLYPYSTVVPPPVPATTDRDGRFLLSAPAPEAFPGAAGVFPPGGVAQLRVVAGGVRFESNPVVAKDGVTEVRIPTLLGIAGPVEVKPAEFAGVVVDEAGKPLPGVKVGAWDWFNNPKYTTLTGPDGAFRLPAPDGDSSFPVSFRKDGYSPVAVRDQAAGVKGLVIALDRATTLEGTVRGPDGKPAAGAVVRAKQGTRSNIHFRTDGTADADGKYRLYVQPDAYTIEVKAAGVGVAAPVRAVIAQGERRPLDVALTPGVTLKARVVDSVTGRPVPGFHLGDWRQKDVGGRSDAKGELTVGGMPPGEFSFRVQAPGYARWWSEQAVREWERKAAGDPATGWQRNFDDLTFDLKPGMGPVTVFAEPAVQITGRVVDPDGKPVAGATAAPARTGSGNSLTGDTRFSVVTKADGTFAMTLPASGAAEHNLVAHDGKYGEWRAWANGVLPPIKTTPGQAITGVTLTLTRPAVVRGKVVDAAGRPVAGREVRAHAADKRENRYYDPTTKTAADGTFELRLVRPGRQFVQVAPFWMDAEDAPAGTSKTLDLAEGRVAGDVVLTAAASPPN